MRFALAASIAASAVLTLATSRPGRNTNGIAIPISKRSQLTNADGSINYDALNSHVASVGAKLIRGVNNYERNTGQSPRPSSQRREATTEHYGAASNSLTDFNNFIWYGTISIGTPSENFTVFFDTGSSDLFVPGSECTSSCEGHKLWDPTKSSTSRNLSKTIQFKYGTGSTIVDAYTDTVSISGLVTLGVATNISSGFYRSDFPPDGLMGMGFRSTSSLDASPFFQTLIGGEQVTKPLFAFKFSSSGAELYLGGTNRDLYTGDFSYAPVTRMRHWEVNVDSVQVDGKTVLHNLSSVIDTGTALIAGKEAQVESFYKQIGGTILSHSVAGITDRKFYSFPCQDMPNISLTIAGNAFDIAPSALNLGRVSPYSSDCISGLVGWPNGPFPSGADWIVGEVFLQNVYTVFDVGELRVGFAKLA